MARGKKADQKNTAPAQETAERTEDSLLWKLLEYSLLLIVYWIVLYILLHAQSEG